MGIRTRILATTAGLAAVVGVSAAIAAAPPAPYFNGFEDANDTSPPAATADHAMALVTRVPSGTNGVSSADGGWHALAPVTSSGGVFTRYGGYSSVFPDGGYTTSIDVYLDTALAGTTDDRLDWSSAVNGPDGNHRRDFMFHLGGNGAGAWLASVSNNAPGWPGNPARDPITITESGWYTLQHRFYDSGAGVLAVDMSVIDADGNVLKTWTLSDASDIIGSTVGGNRYGWLVNNDFANLPIDNITRSGELPQPQSKDDCKKGGWEDLFRADGSTFKNQGDCIQYVNTGK